VSVAFAARLTPSSPDRIVPVPRAPLALLLLAVVLSGCRLDVGAGLVISRDGSATAEVQLRVDAAGLARLDDLGVDPTAELAAVAGQAPGWQVTRETDEDGGLSVRLRRSAPDPAAAADAFRELTAGLAGSDPALLIDLDLDVDEVGAVDLAGTAGFRPPATAGATVDGTPVGPDAAELERLTAEAVHARFSLTVPGAFEEHDADAMEGRTATWELAPGEPREVRAVASAPTGVAVGWLAAGITLLLVLALGAAAWWWRRRPR
jgi:hypothetical protein